MMQNGALPSEFYNLEHTKEVVRHCLKLLYQNDAILFERNNKMGLCERCIVFRLATYLQTVFKEFFVDCDFNSAEVKGREVRGKPIDNPDGLTTTNRYIDIIVHKRTFNQDNDFICFEIKKWNNYDKKAYEKDKNNLKVLTQQYGYKYGFYLTLGKTFKKAKWLVFHDGRIIEDENLVFPLQGT